MRRTRWAAAAIAAAALATVGPAGAQNAATTPEPIAGTGCEEHEAWVDGDAAAVAARLPKRYRAFTDANGAPLVFARAMRCQAENVGGQAAPVTIADWGVVIDTPDGMGCGSGTPGAGNAKGDVPPICSWYVLGLVSDNKRYVDALRDGTPSFPAEYVPDLVYRLGAADGSGQTPFHFVAPGWTIDDSSGFNPGQLSLRGGYWFDTPQGMTKIAVSTDDLTAGHADTTLRAAAGSALAKLMGATERTTPPAYQGFGVIRIGHGVQRKQLLGPALSGEALDSFAGSCSTQGDVAFDPPATNSQAPTTYAYDAKGTCTGTLNGKRLDSAPVRLVQSGRSDASCMQAMTFPPGHGTLTFADGTQMPYTLDFTSKFTEVDGTIYGTRSGWAPLHATFATQRTGPDVVAQCGGTGAKTVPMDMSFTTRTALVDGRPASETSSPAAGAPATARPAPRLRVTVSPRHLHRTRRTRLSFRVRPAVPANVWFDGRRVQARADGRATMVVALHGRPGLRHVRATRRGFHAARGTLMLRR